MKTSLLHLKQSIPVVLVVLLFTTCTKDAIDMSTAVNNENALKTNSSSSIEANSMAASTNGTIKRTVTFGPATTNFSNTCLENIQFGGTIEEIIHKSTDAQGNVHYVRSFNAKGMTGVGLTSGMSYTVVGGNEMFSIKNPIMGAMYPNIGASINNSDVLIHQGTLVFVREDGERVVARHTIIVNPNGTVKNEWTCAGRKN
jgi:hypothetical protein